ncbi:MAG: MerR family transcriptional regulator [Thermodesulfobacteriota bacterium]|nr:MerR family transcriptional regulator [Thermodesulfobacteriota bacterium]
MVHIPDDKRYFRIGEASRIIGVESYVLRYWESEFPQIRPGRADSKQRTYQKKDIEILLEIKNLLYEEKMTIEGAKRRLKEKTAGKTQEKYGFVKQINAELQDILETLN